MKSILVNRTENANKIKNCMLPLQNIDFDVNDTYTKLMSELA